MSGKTKAELQDELDEANEKISNMNNAVYQASQARRMVVRRVSNLRWEEAQTKAKGDAYEDTAERFEEVLKNWPKE